MKIKHLSHFLTEYCNTQSFWKSREDVQNILRINSQAAGAQDEIVVRFLDNATGSFDSYYDAYKLQGGIDAPQFYTTGSDSSWLSLNSLPLNNPLSIVPLNFTFSSAVGASFSASGTESFADNISIYLEDKELNSMINLRDNPVYNFSYVTGNKPDRFRLYFADFTGNSHNSALTTGIAAYSDHNLSLYVPAMQGQMTRISLVNVAGQTILSQKSVINGFTKIPVWLSPGIYLLRVTSGSRSFATKIVGY